MATAMSVYEAARLQRIEENHRRMQELGLVEAAKDFTRDLSLAPKRTKLQRISLQKPGQRASSAEVRRSTRVAGLPAKTYDESVLAGKEEKQRVARASFIASAEEVYTQKHVDALGDYQKEWELFVDGYRADGTRIYDSATGKTCHQCRQKTLGKRTCCSACNSLMGQFCGDCLFMRYGENIDEVLQKVDWVCPVCRDLCNCSNHRIRKGWRPTGTLYRTAIDQGFKSVAHYLVLNNLEGSKQGTDETAQVACMGATQNSEAKPEPPVSSSSDTVFDGSLSPKQPSKNQATPLAVKVNKASDAVALDGLLPKRRSARTAATKENIPANIRSTRRKRAGA